MSKIAWVVIKLELTEDADEQEVTSTMDYNLEHNDILGTEVYETHPNKPKGA
jgi:hypothetical protein